MSVGSKREKKIRYQNSFTRQQDIREAFFRVLILCEGKKTEPNYCKGLAKSLGLHPKNVVIQTPHDNSPRGIVEAAKEQQENYDKIFCVFDKDQHETYQAAINEVNPNDPVITIIFSVPCIEYWLLLHFEDSTRPYRQKGDKSPGQQLVSKLRKYIKDYSKQTEDIFEKTKTGLSHAIVRAKNIEQAQKSTNNDNPSTNFYILVEYLIELKK